MNKLRPHHLLCLQSFVGKGYDLKFTQNIVRLLNNLRTNPKVSITFHEDSVCTSCPNNIESSNDQSTKACKTILKVQRYDQSIAMILSLSENQMIDFNEASTELRHRIQSRADLESICGDCEWFELCLSEWNKRFEDSKKANASIEAESAFEHST